jgi:hypothetical protein
MYVSKNEIKVKEKNTLKKSSRKIGIINLNSLHYISEKVLIKKSIINNQKYNLNLVKIYCIFYFSVYFFF